MALAIFAVTYLFISGIRIRPLALDRSGGALLGAFLMVATGIVLPEEAFNYSSDVARRAVDVDTLVLLFGMMLLSVYLTDARMFRACAQWAIHFAKTPRGLLVWIAVTSAVLSAFFVNDTICLALTPLVLTVLERTALSPIPFLLALCMGANAGSLATFAGNPQNMIIANASKMPYATFSAFMALPAAVSTAAVIFVLLIAFKKELAASWSFTEEMKVTSVDRPLLALGLVALAGVVTAFFAGFPLGWSALGGAVFVMALSNKSPREQIERVDAALLVFFASLFVVVYGVYKEGWADRMREAFAPIMQGGPIRELFGFSLLSLLGSNLLSNVPFVMLAKGWVEGMQNPDLGWQTLALSSTLAGNLTLVGSVANLIVFEVARKRASLSFWGYFRIGLPATALSLLLGLLCLWLEHRLMGRFF